MHLSTLTRVSALAIAILAPLSAGAVEFVSVGPRATGMGGAGVAVTTDALATYWNPAGLAMTQTVDIRLQAGAQAIDRLGIADAVRDLEDFNPNDSSQANQAKAQDIANRLNRPGANTSLNGSAGLYIKGHIGEHAFGINVSDVATGGSFISNPVQVNGNNISGAMALQGLEVRQVALSYAYAFADKMFSFGVTGKLMQGAAYSGNAPLQGGTELKLTDYFGQATISTALGVDIGAIYRPTSWLRFGAVAKDINQPTFKAPGGGELRLNPQVRAGMAINPYSSLTLTMDVDATSNKTLVPGVKSQLLSLGAEQTILTEFLSFRVGAFKNMQDATTPFTPTAGLGLRIFAFRLDLGGGYDFREKGALASGSISMTF
ncbi:conserved exported protein of unknown function [Nitrospira sp. KM1]|uniref:conjugal transfer protein TraF n=1 Tax=Nitrospira sp. KM1 TaxID=1936990 RepID=UPI0013A79AC1|nr:conjugal transfer protein TraF [Nitrospira sp. KM1]BCA53423.1 conserved exported protein of unknown function [Nitrospira sp. KM1]